MLRCAHDGAMVLVQDKEASDSMEPAMNLMQLGGLIRRAVALVKGMDIRVSEDSFRFGITSVVPGFKVGSRTTLHDHRRSASLVQLCLCPLVPHLDKKTVFHVSVPAPAVDMMSTHVQVWESYPMSGESRRHRRRDMRGGGAEGRVTATADGLLRIDVTWGEPHAGAGHDLYVMPDADTLLVKSYIQLAHGSAGYNIVYRRRM